MLYLVQSPNHIFCSNNAFYGSIHKYSYRQNCIYVHIKPHCIADVREIHRRKSCIRHKYTIYLRRTHKRSRMVYALNLCQFCLLSLSFSLSLSLAILFLYLKDKLFSQIKSYHLGCEVAKLIDGLILHHHTIAIFNC